jgi:hypothetical protein
MPEQIANPLTEARETGRLEASSDGVFAIAITLLVLELKVPNLPTAGSSPAALGKALLQQWPSYVGLVTSFFTILIMWVHHHAILRNVCRTDAWLHFANGCLLLGVTFVPYPRRFWRPICERQRQKWLPCFIQAHSCSSPCAFICLSTPRSASRCCHRRLRWDLLPRRATTTCLVLPCTWLRHCQRFWTSACR